MYDVIITGGGAAGLTAALYASRLGLKTLVITKDIGGQALLTSHIENYPGFDTIGGLELMEKLKGQAENFDVSFIYEEVKEIQPVENWFKVKTSRDEYSTTALILTFGKIPRDLGVPGEERLTGQGVSYCFICDGFLFRDKRVAVVGWGDPAVEAALKLCSIAKKVYVIFKGDTLLANEEIIGKCANKNRVEFISNSEVLELIGESVLQAIKVKHRKTKKVRKIPLDGLFIEMGYTPKTDLVKDLVSLNSKGEIIVDKSNTTSYPGIFAAGDVSDIPFKQVIISAGEGAVAALSAYNYIQKYKGKPTITSDWKKLTEDTKTD
jgi:thioredoxin reductase (NADPH)